MSVQLCSHCKSPYWRFRGDHPPKGFCQMACFDAHKAGRKPAAPALPSNILMDMMEHRRRRHNSPDILIWWDCRECEDLEKLYSEALEWHYDRITKEIVGEASSGV